MALVGGKIQIRTIYHLQKMFLTTNVIFKYLYLILAFLVQFITIFYFYFHFILSFTYKNTAVISRRCSYYFFYTISNPQINPSNTRHFLKSA